MQENNFNARVNDSNASFLDEMDNKNTHIDIMEESPEKPLLADYDIVVKRKKERMKTSIDGKIRWIDFDDEEEATRI